MRVALAADYLFADHSVADVSLDFHIVFVYWFVKAGPAGAGVKYGIRRKERVAAADAAVGSRRGGVFVLAGKRRLGALLAGHMVFIRRELLFPFGIGFLDLIGHMQSSVELNFGILNQVGDNRLDTFAGK